MTTDRFSSMTIEQLAVELDRLSEKRMEAIAANVRGELSDAELAAAESEMLDAADEWDRRHR